MLTKRIALFIFILCILSFYGGKGCFTPDEGKSESTGASMSDISYLTVDPSPTSGSILKRNDTYPFSFKVNWHFSYDDYKSSQRWVDIKDETKDSLFSDSSEITFEGQDGNKVLFTYTKTPSEIFVGNNKVSLYLKLRKNINGNISYNGLAGPINYTITD
jgi:hypothetical protein